LTRGRASVAALLVIGVSGCPALLKDDFVVAGDSDLAGTVDGASEMKDVTTPRGPDSTVVDGGPVGSDSGEATDSSDAASVEIDEGADAGIEEEALDGSSLAETGSGVASDATTTADQESPPTCSSANCGGCCNNGTCVGGGSTATCGLGGQTCSSCSGSTPICSGGVCVAAAPDAGTSSCAVASCTNTCTPFYQTNCCKSDGTCGCEVSFSNDCQ
jgi:hypothetical protein